MRTFAIVLLFLAASFSAFAAEEETPAQLAARAETVSLDQRSDLYLRAAAQELKTADSLYTQGKAEEASHQVELVTEYARRATDASVSTGKRLKNAEIEIRKMALRLRDIQRSLSFDDQAPVKAAVDRLEDFRTKLLERMFAKDKKK
jgi:hypothetical protein